MRKNSEIFRGHYVAESSKSERISGFLVVVSVHQVSQQFGFTFTIQTVAVRVCVLDIEGPPDAILSCPNQPSPPPLLKEKPWDDGKGACACGAYLVPQCAVACPRIQESAALACSMYGMPWQHQLTDSTPAPDLRMSPHTVKYQPPIICLLGLEEPETLSNQCHLSQAMLLSKDAL